MSWSRSREEFARRPNHLILQHYISHEECLLVPLCCSAPSVSVMPVSILALHRLCLHFILLSVFAAVTRTNLPQLSHTNTHTHMHLQLSACCLMFHPHTVAVEAKRAGSIKQRTDSPAACQASNCGFITDRADQYDTLDSARRRMIWSLSYWNFFYRGGLDTSIRVWGWRDLAPSHI